MWYITLALSSSSTFLYVPISDPVPLNYETAYWVEINNRPKYLLNIPYSPSITVVNKHYVFTKCLMFGKLQNNWPRIQLNFLSHLNTKFNTRISLHFFVSPEQQTRRFGTKMIKIKAWETEPLRLMEKFKFSVLWQWWSGRVFTNHYRVLYLHGCLV